MKMFGLTNQVNTSNVASISVDSINNAQFSSITSASDWQDTTIRQSRCVFLKNKRHRVLSD